MRRAIKYTCSHCQRETYFDSRARISFHDLFALECHECGESGAIFTLNVEAPPDMPIFIGLPKSEEMFSRRRISFTANY
jgi:hypothetical protein